SLPTSLLLYYSHFRQHPNPSDLEFAYYLFVQLIQTDLSSQMNCSAPSNLNLNSLFLNYGNHSRISIKAERGRYPCQTSLGFARLSDCTRRLEARFCLANGNGGAEHEAHGITNRDGVIIVDHGSRRKESNLMLNEFVAMFVEKTGYPIVEAAHMELAEPSIKDAFRSCVQKGANRVIVSPFFLFPGRHWHQDIPSLTAEAAKDYPGVSYMVTAPLGLHPLLVDVLDDRIKHCVSHVAGDAEECAVCAGTGKCQLR
nr:sirohydrochlorin ferrochelatase, chloroplastic [Tanacetum cinerariifolium]